MPVATDLRKTGIANTSSTRRARAATVGSSLTDVCFTSSALYGVRRRLSRSWFDWMNGALGEKAMDLRYTYAVGGALIAEILTQIQTAVTQDVEWIVGDLGVINDVMAGTSVATMKARVRLCIDAIAASGKKGLLLNATPLATGHASASLSTHRKLSAVNADMALYGRQKGVLVFDASKVIVDGVTSNTNGLATTSLLQADLIHYAHTGSRAIGAALATLVTGELPAFPLLTSSQADSYNSTDNPNQLCTNPLMIGSVAVTGGTGLTGNMPTGRSVSAAGGTFTGTSAVATRADGYGQDWVITITAASLANARLFLVLEPDMTANLATGDVLYAAASVQMTGLTNLLEHQFSLTPSGASDFAAVHELSGEAAAITEYSQSDFTGGVMITPELTIPSGSVSNRLIFSIQFSSTTAAAVIKIGRVGIWRL